MLERVGIAHLADAPARSLGRKRLEIANGTPAQVTREPQVIEA